MTAIVGSVLVRNEDVFVEQAIRNVVAFCDRIHVVDHVSDDGTWEILQSLARELDELDVHRSRSSALAHRLLEPYAGTETWVIGVDGDELYDPTGLARLRAELLGGAHADVFRLKAHVLNCDRLDAADGLASGWLAPPSRPVTKLFNFAAVESWTDSPDPLQSGDAAFKPGYEWESRRDLADGTTWDNDPLRCLHVCFLQRSSRELETRPRRNLDESREFDRGPLASLKRRVRRSRPAANIAEFERRGTNWKREWYARGDRVSVDATPFFGQTRTARSDTATSAEAPKLGSDPGSEV
jgi:glycosyltransferase involved in cell wall biosynthesis